MGESVGLQVLDVFERHVRQAFSEAAVLLRGASHDDVASEAGATGALSWSSEGLEAGVTQRWPDGSVDSYSTYEVWRCEAGPHVGMKLALGAVATPGKENEVVGFVLGSGGGSRRPLTVFFPADDFGTTGERLSLIRGKGGGDSRKGYAPHEPLPPAYAGFKTDVLGARIAGKWNVRAVVADRDDELAMLEHTAIQARLRGIA